MQPHLRPWQPVGGVRSVDHTSRGATYNINVWEDVGQVYTYSLSGSPSNTLLLLLSMAMLGHVCSQLDYVTTPILNMSEKLTNGVVLVHRLVGLKEHTHGGWG